MRPLVLHVSALSNEEYDLYTRSLDELIGLSDNGSTPLLNQAEVGAYYSRASVNLRDTRAWLKGRYPYASLVDIDAIFNLFYPTTASVLQLTGGQFFVVMRLVMHILAGERLRRDGAFYQALPNKNISYKYPLRPVLQEAPTRPQSQSQMPSPVSASRAPASSSSSYGVFSLENFASRQNELPPPQNPGTSGPPPPSDSADPAPNGRALPPSLLHSPSQPDSSPPVTDVNQNNNYNTPLMPTRTSTIPQPLRELQAQAQAPPPTSEMQPQPPSSPIQPRPQLPQPSPQMQSLQHPTPSPDSAQPRQPQMSQLSSQSMPQRAQAQNGTERSPAEKQQHIQLRQPVQMQRPHEPRPAPQSQPQNRSPVQTPKKVHLRVSPKKSGGAISTHRTASSRTKEKTLRSDRKSILPKSGDIVLGKLDGYPAWPGHICDLDTIPDYMLSDRPCAEVTKRCSDKCDGRPCGEITWPVRFFPEGDYMWLPAKDIHPLPEHDIHGFLQTASKSISSDLKEGYNTALDPTDWYERNPLDDGSNTESTSAPSAPRKRKRARESPEWDWSRQEQGPPAFARKPRMNFTSDGSPKKMRLAYET